MIFVCFRRGEGDGDSCDVRDCELVPLFSSRWLKREIAWFMIEGVFAESVIILLCLAPIFHFVGSGNEEG